MLPAEPVEMRRGQSQLACIDLDRLLAPKFPVDEFAESQGMLERPPAGSGDSDPGTCASQTVKRDQDKHQARLDGLRARGQAPGKLCDQRGHVGCKGGGVMLVLAKAEQEN